MTLATYLKWRKAMERQYGRMIYAPIKLKEINNHAHD